MSVQTEVTKRLNIEYPILQAPMAGGGDTPDLVVAVCEAGGAGSVGCAYLTPDQISAAAENIRNRTNRCFGVNLFAPVETPKLPDDPTRAIEKISPFYDELGLGKPEIPESGGFDFDQQLEAVLESGASVFSFTFGAMPQNVIDAAKARGMYVMGTATTVREAEILEGAGVDAVVAQSAEAGGHRGTFSGDFDAGLVGAISLIPQIVDAVRAPVIASGGIMDGRGIAAALVLGASAVQLGTAFLTSHEAGIADVYKDSIMLAEEDQTRITRAFSGRPARGIRNRFIEAYEDASDPNAILPFPYQNALTRPLRAAAGKQNKAEFLSLWAGQGVRLARRKSATDIFADLVREMEDALARL